MWFVCLLLNDSNLRPAGTAADRLVEGQTIGWLVVDGGGHKLPPFTRPIFG
jgi:hypothetical protein